MANINNFMNNLLRLTAFRNCIAEGEVSTALLYIF